MEKPTICIGENKGADQLRGNREADQRLCFRFGTRILQSLYFLNTKFHASSSFLCLYRSVCVGPVRKPHCWFSHEAAQMSPRDDTNLFSDMRPILNRPEVCLSLGPVVNIIISKHYFNAYFFDN